MAQTATDILFWSLKRNLKGRLSRLRVQLRKTEETYRLDDKIARIRARIENIRQLNYRSQTSLEADQIKVAEFWESIDSSIKQKFENEAAMLQTEASVIDNEIAFTDDPHQSLNPIENLLSIHEAKVSDFSNRTQQTLAPVLSCLSSIEHNLSEAENTINLTSMASFQWQQGETPVFALIGKDMDKKIEVVLTLTNQRLLYESTMKNELERPSKHSLYLVVKKERERKLLLERPISSVDKITKGKLGLLTGEGLLIEFKQSTDPKLKLGYVSASNNSRRKEDDLAIRYFNMISSGQIDDEIKKSPLQTKQLERVNSCSSCGAPFTDGIYRRPLERIGIIRVAGGRTACKYCGTITDASAMLYTNMATGDTKEAWCVCPNCGIYISGDVEFCACGAKLPERVDQKCDICGSSIKDVWNKHLCPEEHIVCKQCSGTLVLKCLVCEKPLVF